MMCHDVERELDAYVDRELDGEMAGRVDGHLEGCTVCRRQVAERQALGRLVRALPYHQASDRLRARVVARRSRSRRGRQILTCAAAVVLMVSIGGGIGLLRTAAPRSDLMTDEVVAGHVRSLLVDHLFDVESTDQHTVKPWFLGKIDFAPPVADFAASGFPLVGGRLDYLGGRPVAALVYQRQQHTINVFVSGGSDATPAGGHSVRGFHVHHWIRNGLSFWTVSDLNDTELTDFTRLLQAS